MKDEIKDFN